MAELPDLERRAREIAVELTGWPSITGTRDEAAFAPRLAALLGRLPYFRDHPGQVVVQPLPDDPLGRANVLAVVRGRGTRTVALSGHFDVVPVDDYGDLAPLAWTPERLRDGLIQRLRATGAHPLALADLESRDFLPGRGLLDMKSGLAAGIAVMEHFAAQEGRDGNMILIATPDEEDRSAGMRAAADALPGFLERLGLDVVLGINLDATCDNGDGTAGQVAALGCIGKLLLSALVVGKEAHACYPLDGVNAAYLAAELATELEFAPELGEEAGAELASPPTALGSRDLKTVYNVTTPGRAWANWNVLIQRRSAVEVLEVAAGLARRAADRARDRIRERAGRLRNRVDISASWSRIEVMTFAEVMETARRRSEGFAAAYDERARALAGRADLDLPARCRLLTEFAWDAAGLDGPAIVLGFASMPYPAVNLGDGEAAGHVERLVQAAAAETSRAFRTPIGVVRHLPVIVDMSFLGPVHAADLRFAAGCTPVWGSSIRWDIGQAATPGFPMVNIGPWGRDYHHWLERVHVFYAYRVLPALLRNVAARALEGPG